MSEKENMLNGLSYAPFDEELVKERARAKMLCFEYNGIRPDKVVEREDLLKKLLGKTKKTFLIEQNFFCDYGYNIEIGENFYSNHNLVILDPAKVTFGDNVFIGPNCGFYTARHPVDSKERITFIEDSKPISVGDNVWFGGNVTVLAGVTIGSNTVIGAGSVVTKDIPSNVVAAGNPCQVIRNL